MKTATCGLEPSQRAMLTHRDRPRITEGTHKQAADGKPTRMQIETLIYHVAMKKLCLRCLNTDVSI